MGSGTDYSKPYQMKTSPASGAGRAIPRQTVPASTLSIRLASVKLPVNPSIAKYSPVGTLRILTANMSRPSQIAITFEARLRFTEALLRSRCRPDGDMRNIFRSQRLPQSPLRCTCRLIPNKKDTAHESRQCLSKSLISSVSAGFTDSPAAPARAPAPRTAP